MPSRPEAPSLSGRTILLRRPVPEDVAARLVLGRDPIFHRMVGGDPSRSARPYTRADAERWYDQVASNPIAWCIERAGRLVGGISLHSLDERHLSARLAIGVFSAADRAMGTGTEAIHLALAYAFDSLRLHRVDLRVLAFNTTAIRLYKKCGFVSEGTERESANIGGEWHDDVRMSILEHEFRPVSKR